MTQTYNAAVMNVFAELEEFVIMDELVEEQNENQEMNEPAVMNVFAELGEFVIIDELIEEQNKYQEMYEMINPVMEEVFRTHSCEFTDELLKKTKKERLIFDVKEHGVVSYGDHTNGCKKLTKNDILSFIREKQITRHFDDFYLHNNLTKLNRLYRVINKNMKELATFLENPKENKRDITKYMIKAEENHEFIIETMNEEMTKYELLR